MVGALKDASKVIELDPSWSRGYQRTAAALKMMGDQKEAMKALEKGLQLDRNNKGLLELKEELINDMEDGS